MHEAMLRMRALQRFQQRRLIKVRREQHAQFRKLVIGVRQIDDDRRRFGHKLFGIIDQQNDDFACSIERGDSFPDFVPKVAAFRVDCYLEYAGQMRKQRFSRQSRPAMREYGIPVASLGSRKMVEQRRLTAVKCATQYNYLSTKLDQVLYQIDALLQGRAQIQTFCVHLDAEHP